MVKHISHDTLQTANIHISYYLLTNLTTKLTAGMQPAAHSFFSITNRHDPLILLLLLLLPPGRILLIPKSFDSTTFNRKQLIMDTTIVYSCKQFIIIILVLLSYLWCLWCYLSKSELMIWEFLKTMYYISAIFITICCVMLWRLSVAVCTLWFGCIQIFYIYRDSWWQIMARIYL